MNQLDLLEESKALTLALVLRGIVTGDPVMNTTNADPWNPWPWP